MPSEEYETKLQHKQLFGMMLCSRCSDLCNGRMVNAVAGQGGARLSKGLITPVELRDQLTYIREKKVLVVKVVDVTDFHGSFLNRVRDVVGGNPILLVLTKVDLLPQGTDLDALRVRTRFGMGFGIRFGMGFGMGFGYHHFMSSSHVVLCASRYHKKTRFFYITLIKRMTPTPVKSKTTVSITFKLDDQTRPTHVLRIRIVLPT